MTATRVWREGSFPTVPVARVAVLAFDYWGRVALVSDRGRCGFPGGQPVVEDRGSWKATSRRRIREDAGLIVTDLTYLGWLEVRGEKPLGRERAAYADVRMVGRIDHPAPGPGGRRAGEVVLASPDHARLRVTIPRDQAPRMLESAAEHVWRQFGLRAVSATPAVSPHAGAVIA